MKKILAGLALVALSTTAFAHDHGGFRGGYRGGYHGGYGGGWVAPALIGGVIGYELARPYYQQPPVVYTQPAPTVYQNCTAWVETVDQYGNVTRTRTCY